MKGLANSMDSFPGKKPEKKPVKPVVIGNPFSKTLTQRGLLAEKQAAARDAERHSVREREKTAMGQAGRVYEQALKDPASVRIEDLNVALNFYLDPRAGQGARAADLVGAMLSRGPLDAERTDLLDSTLQSIANAHLDRVHEMIARPSLPVEVQERVLNQFLKDAMDESWFEYARKAMIEFGWSDARQEAFVKEWFPKLSAGDREEFAQAFELDEAQQDRLLAT